MGDAYLLGAGQSPFGSFPDESYRSLFETAFDEALSSVDGSFDPGRIEEAYVGSLGGGGHQPGLSGPAITEHPGLHSIPSVRLENACAASSFALRSAVRAVRSGDVDVALAGDLSIGDAVDATVRRLYDQEGLARYGVKFAPGGGGR